MEITPQTGHLLRRIFFLGIFLFYVGFATWEFFNYNPKPKNIASARERWQKVHFPYDMFKTGDLVLRRGKGFVSDAMLNFCKKDPRYSHTGIIKRDENGKLWVFHSIGGESRESNAMLKEPVEIFCHPDAAFNFGLYRWDLSESELYSFDSLIVTYYNAGLEFDLDFDMSTDETMYCSEMIYKALNVATKGKNFIPLSTVMDKPYVAVDDLYLNDHCKKLFEYNYD
ncbi:MAG: hypothetical protein H6581_12255 [Bacteroidia bacterium]|nr:hypothetical protein [Bacteroidia bacterium]